MIHRLTAMISMLCVTVFLISTVGSELTGEVSLIISVKSKIVFPGLLILVPAMMVTGFTGFLLSQKRKGRYISNKMKRMPFIVINGLFLLVPLAFVLNQWAEEGKLDSCFYFLQMIEISAGLINLYLMGLNMRDGRRMTRK